MQLLTRSTSVKHDPVIDVRPSNVTQILNDRLTGKVIDWVFKNRVDHGNVAEFRWDLEDKALLQKIFANPKTVGLDLPMQDSKFRRFVQSIIQNGLNSTDVELFQRFKHRLPLRSLGLAHELSDFSFSKSDSGCRLASKNLCQSGFYMLEVCIDPRQYSARIQIEATARYVKRGGVKKYPLRAKSDTVAKRLLWLKHDANLELIISTPDQAPLTKRDFTHFRLARLTRNFFLSRLYKKLGKSFDVKRAERVTDEALEEQWKLYQQLFTQANAQAVSRSKHTLARATTKVTSPQAQLREILRLLAARR
jgi:hypothetical protein